jgi:hypothetical protein
MSTSATFSPWQPARTATVHVHVQSLGHHLPDGIDQPDGNTFAGITPTAAAPIIVGDALTQVLYLQEPRTSAPISPYDINQGQMSDCFLCSSIGELAMWDPGAISNMIQANANGTETVTLYLAAGGGLPTFGTTSFVPTTITVSNSFPSNAINGGATQDVYNGQKEIWPQVLEKAIATLDGGYNAIANGGNPVIALEEITGLPATYVSPGALSLSQLQSYAAAGNLIVMDTGYNQVGYGLYDSHAYMFQSIITVNGQPAVQLLNPWGFDNPAPIPFSQLAGQIAEVDIGTGPATSGPPSLALQTPDQTWKQGARVSLVLSANTFIDPQRQALTYAAAQSNGQALPSWLSFSASTRTFSGTVPSGMETLSISVTATDTSGQSGSETFQVTVPAMAPTVTHATATQTWTQGTQLAFTPAANTFTDPQGQALSFTAALTNGQALPSWLSCNASTGAFTGTVPYTSTALAIKLTATDTSGLSVSESFTAALAAPAPTVTDQTANQAWVAGSSVSHALASDTFTAVPGQTLTYAATLPAGLTFTAATETIGGTAPVIPGTYTIRVTATETSRLSVSETFQAAVTASAPAVTDQTAAQAWTASQAISLRLAADTFTDPQGEKLTYTVSGLPSGVTFNAATGTFGGHAPTAPGTYTIKVTATDTSRLAVSETFQAAVTASAPAVTDQTADQAWTAAQRLSFTLAADTFTDPQGEKLTYKAMQSNGRPLPTGMVFNQSTGAFTGTAPFAPGTYAIQVTATDLSGFTAPETFNAVVSATAPAAAQTADQIWTAGQRVSLATAFTDPQSERLTYAAAQSNGSALPKGVAFSAATGAFSGTPAAPGSYALTVTATDASGLSETFNATVQAAAPAAHASPNLLWTDGQTPKFLVPASVFTDPQGSPLTYAAYQVGGDDQTAWLHFNPSPADLFGTVPAGLSGTIGIELVATNGYGLSATETFGLSFIAAGTLAIAAPFTAAPSELIPLPT